MPNRRKISPKSIRWKWGFRLTIAFALIFLLVPSILLSGFRSRLYEQEKRDAQAFVTEMSDTFGQIETRLTRDNVESLIEKISVSTNSRGVVKVGNVPYLEELTDKGIVIRIFNGDGDLLYQSRQNNSVFNRNSGYYFEETKFNGREGFVGGDTIVSPTNSVLRGYVQVFFRLYDFHELMASVNKLVFLIILIGIVVSIILGYGFAQLFFRPIKQMADTMYEITEDNLSETRLSVNKSRQEDELTDLSIQINTLLDKMGKYVTQQKQFVEDVSHELRTPTAIVEGHLKLLNRWGKDDPQVLDESLKASLNEITRMKTLVQEMLDLSRAEQVQDHYQNETTQVRDVVTQIFHNFEILYPDFNFFLDDDLSEERTVKIYRNHLEQILVILLDNAVKYSTNRKEIHISISETLMKIQIAIQDFGEGMSQEDQQKVFNRFYRIDKARSREKGGHGLGLSIAKELLEGYKGDISVESALGHGTVFRIQLPFIETSKRERNTIEREY
ncbi:MULTISPECIES: HAMP domain-containing sensor histidine kinase [unclassified Jeotgalibaca]|uniref:HAMP domain-containing sensor histidine kinase n=1 Tax=unclassified Jeotgalibaca TaxID=2621505 RepID=UPI003FCF68E7